MMKNFIRFFLIGISLVTLLYAAQTSLFKGVQNAQAEQPKICEPGKYKTECTGQQAGCAADAGEARVFQCNSDGSGWDEGQSQCETSCAQPAPTPTPAPTCGDFIFKYNECFACNKSRSVSQDSCGNYNSVDNPGTDAACASWCPAPTPTPAITPTPTPTPAVTPTPTPTPGCVPDGSCNAAAPACGTTTTGKNNCDQACTKVGVACNPGCTPNGSCSAVMPSACGSINTGKDNCDNVCFRQSAACQSQGGININNTNTNTNNNSQNQSVNVGLGSGTQVLGAKELPKTGLPAVAWLVSALVPTGFGLRRFKGGIKKELENDPNFIWEDRQFKSH